ncbi:hypothetical protein CG736_25430 [Kitasatospora sp. CB02891]|nr:hypothetical protein CG736_25430 [Kitasatospora sp. CB02891]
MAAGGAGGVSGASFTLFAAGPDRTLDDLAPDVVARLRDMTHSTRSKHTADEPDLRIPVHDTRNRAARIDVPVPAVNGAVDSPDHLGMAERLTRTAANGRAVSIDGTACSKNSCAPCDLGVTAARVARRPGQGGA